MQDRPEITYPCEWSYVVVGEGEERLFAHIEAAVGGTAHTKVVSRHSTSGRYTSIELTLVVEDEEHRLVLFRALQGHPAVRYVL